MKASIRPADQRFFERRRGTVTVKLTALEVIVLALLTLAIAVAIFGIVWAG